MLNADTGTSSLLAVERDPGPQVSTRGIGRVMAHVQDLPAQDGQSGAELDQVGVVGDIGARRAEMNHAPRGGRGICEGVHMRHDVVPEPLLVSRHRLEIDIVEMEIGRAHV